VRGSLRELTVSGNDELAHLELLGLTVPFPHPLRGCQPSGQSLLRRPLLGKSCTSLSTLPSIPPLTGGQWALPVFLGSLAGRGSSSGSPPTPTFAPSITPARSSTPLEFRLFESHPDFLKRERVFRRRCTLSRPVSPRGWCAAPLPVDACFPSCHQGDRPALHPTSSPRTAAE